MGILTNGCEWRLYHSFAKGGLAEKLVFVVDLLNWDTDQQHDSVFDQLWLVSKDAFLTSDGPASWLNAKRIDGLLNQALTDPSSPEVKYLRKRLQEQGVAVTVDDVAAWLKNRLEASNLASLPSPGDGKAVGASVSTQGTLAPEPAAPSYWLIPAGRRHGLSAAEHLKLWLGSGFWGFGESTPGRKTLRAGDFVCFYAAEQAGILAYARMAGLANVPVTAEEWPEPAPPDGLTYKLPLTDITWLPVPVKLDAAIRARLDAFAGSEPTRQWGFFVQTTRRLTSADFDRLTGRA